MRSRRNRVWQTSARAGFVQDGEGALIGGFMLRGDALTGVIVRALGPSLSGFGVSNVLADPTLDVRNANGDSIGFNDNWADDAAQAAALSKIGLNPSDQHEAALSMGMPAGDYTVIVVDKQGGTGVALVELYNLGK